MVSKQENKECIYTLCRLHKRGPESDELTEALEASIPKLLSVLHKDHVSIADDGSSAASTAAESC